jgi:O-methyltransferase
VIKSLVRSAFRRYGFDIVRYRPGNEGIQFPPDVSSADRSILDQVAGYTMTSVERQIALIQAVRHLVRYGIKGAVVECGVWRGGSSMAIALTLAQEGDTTRDLYLFDTFEGMTPSQDVDKTVAGTLAQSLLDRDPEKTGWIWAIAGIEEVRKNVGSTGYPQERVRYVKGPVEATIPSHAPPGPIALLRLDTDWYKSTKHELTHLFPLLRDGGFLIIDDYGHWEGAKRAVDEYFADYGRSFYLHRIDYTGRLLVKQSPL